MVKKHDGSWRMCVDFKDLNKACPKDGYPLPEIDWKVESLCGFPFKCFLDAYKGYHQIKMAKEDKEKNAFITSQGIFCYSKMPFSLRNAGAMYQRLVDKAFHKQIDRNLEDVQKVNGKLASLNRFLAKSAEKSLPFFKTLKKCTKKSDFYWIEEAESMFKQMKQLIAKLPMLIAPEGKEELIVYLPATKEAQLIAKLPMLIAPEGKEELIVYLPATKEAVSAVLMTEREAKQMLIYFVSRALRGPEVNYTSMEKLVLALLGEYAIHYRPRVSVKGQILADFIVERPKEDYLDTLMEVEEELLEPWILFEATNNEVEYEDLIAGLRIAEQMGVKKRPSKCGLTISGQPGQRNLHSKGSRHDLIHGKGKDACQHFAHLSNQVLVEELKEKSINKAEALAVVEEEEVNKARSVRRKSQRFAVVSEVLYKKSFLGPWLRCVMSLQENYVLREIHEGSCSMHAGTRSVVAKALRTGYYWPTMQKDARTLIRACQGCQVYWPVLRNPQQKLTPITSPWPFYKWGIDIAGPFSEGPGKVKFLIVAIEYFTKWIEASHPGNQSGPLGRKDIVGSDPRGDLVYRSNDASRAEEVGKLGPKWEVPYEVTEALGKGAYKLRDRDGKQLPRTWNIHNLKKCYVHEM
ncbi:reverse transcriptase domain-containing protein [Tanacetum coccineum]